MSQQGANETDYDDADDPAEVVVSGDFDFATKKKKRTVTQATIDGHLITALQPKDALMVRLGQMSYATGIEQLEIADLFIERCFDKASAKFIRDRLDDEEDDFDIIDLDDIVQKLVKLWSGGRPTGRSGGSAKRSRSTGRRSTARSR